LSRFTLRLAITLQAAISAGDGLALIALANRVYQSSHASWAVAAVFLALTVPITTLSPVAGLLPDRVLGHGCPRNFGRASASCARTPRRRCWC
jgi:MFS family permease